MNTDSSRLSWAGFAYVIDNDQGSCQVRLISEGDFAYRTTVCLVTQADCRGQDLPTRSTTTLRGRVKIRSYRRETLLPVLYTTVCLVTSSTHVSLSSAGFAYIIIIDNARGRDKIGSYKRETLPSVLYTTVCRVTQARTSHCHGQGLPT